MTVVLGQRFLQGVILVADCRASLERGGKSVPWRDNTQKIFRLHDHMFIGFAGDIDFAGAIIGFLIEQIRKRPKLQKVHIFADKVPKLIKYAYDVLCQEKLRKPPIAFIVAGMDHSRPAKALDQNGKLSGYLPFYDIRLLKVVGPDFHPVETTMVTDPIVIIGSGEPALTDALEEDFKKMQFGFALAGPLAYSAMLVSGSLLDGAKKLGIDSVGGMMQIATIENDSSGFVPYRGRSDENKGPDLDLEMFFDQSGRMVQKNLVTGEEIPLLLPPEVMKIKDPSTKLFADLDLD